MSPPKSCAVKGITKANDSTNRSDDGLYAVMIKAFLSVALPSCLMFYLVYRGYFDEVFTENGTEHYAERPSLGMKAILPKWIKMPLNCAINFGYVIMSAYWCASTSAALEARRITSMDAYVSYVFNFMAFSYGPVQLLRILTQLHPFAVLDQWFTLPFFMWVFVWSNYLLASEWDVCFVIQYMALSVGSYALTLLITVGFEIVLAAHVIIAVVGAVVAYHKYPCSDCKYPFIMSLLCCAGFVGLKLLDLELPKVHQIFTKISGHFLSKIADIYQIHYVNKYFFTLMFYKNDAVIKKQD